MRNSGLTFLIVAMVAVLASTSNAVVVTFEAGDGATYNAGLDRYEVNPDTVVTVNLMADADIESIDIGAITVDNTGTPATQGVSSVGVLAPQLTYSQLMSPGELKDGTQRNVVLYAVQGRVWFDDPGTPDVNESDPAPAGAPLYSFQVQAGEDGTTITIDDLIGPPPVNPYGSYPINTFISSGGVSGAYDLAALTLFVVVGEVDNCPDDPAKLEPGICGCGVADTDSDGDGCADCVDECADDADKCEAGVCGCGLADTDTDGDGCADCIDQCPDDPNKCDVGMCGCGAVPYDCDGDGVGDVCDPAACPTDQCTCIGDTNQDGQVDLEDLQNVADILLAVGSPFIAPCDP